MSEQSHDHYFKDVSNLKHIDVYRVLLLFGVTDPCLQHATKKLLCAGTAMDSSAIAVFKLVLSPSAN